VRLVTELGMVALLDLHWNSLTSCGSYGQQPMADYPGAINFWQQVAARYKNNPLVAFDLYNEPHGISDQVWRFGGDVEWNGETFHAAGMQQMYAAVRGTGARNLVIASGQRWGNLWPSTAPLAGDNIVYGIHAYTCPLHPPPNCDNGAPYDPNQYFKYWSTASERVPVAVTEFGWPNPQDGRYITAVTQYAAARGWGWTAFSWANTSWGAFSLLANAGPGSAYEPQPTGEALLAAFPGG
jgi:endoglucanase